MPKLKEKSKDKKNSSEIITKKRKPRSLKDKKSVRKTSINKKSIE